MRALCHIFLLAALVACTEGDRWPIPPEVDGAIHTDEAILSAVGTARAAVLASPASVEARLELGKYLAAADLYGQARTAFEQALEVGADDARTHAYLAMACYETGDLEAGLASIMAARERAADHAPLAWREGLWRLELGDPDTAYVAFEAATRIDPADPVGWIGLARADLQRGRPAAALAALERARSVARGRLTRYVDHLAGTSLQRLGRPEEAKVLFARGDPQDFVPHDPWQAELAAYSTGTYGRMRLARRALRKGDAAEATAILEDLVHTTQPTRHVIDNLVSCYLVVSDFAKAASTLERYEGKLPPSANTLYLTAVVLRSAGAPDAELRGVLAGSLELNPRFAPSLGMMAELELESGEYQAARDFLEQALADGEPQLQWLTLAAGVAERLGDWQGAVKHLERATLLAPDDGGLQEALAKARQHADTAGAR